MAQNRSRFVLLCQQSLAFGLVVAIAAPAANMVTLDIVAPPHPQQSADQGRSVVRGAADRGSATSEVASEPVEPQVRTVPLSGVSKAGLRALGEPAPAAALPNAARLASARTDDRTDDQTDDLAALSAPLPVGGLSTLGVTWSTGTDVSDRAIMVSVRTRSDETWSRWTKVPYHEEEGPDPSSTEGRTSKPGTDPIYVGDVDDVQVKTVTSSGRAPAGMSLALVDPGQEHAPKVQKPDIDTGNLRLSAADTTASTAKASLTAASVTTRPKIYSRSQWGADERMRDKSSLHYNEVHAGFVHHTVNANSYTRSQVPAIIRGIYAYHTQSRGWSDVGYNFLVDRFGRIWEGRYGGVNRPVVGAHTLGYNDDAFAMSAIGNYDVTRPSSATVNAFGRLFAWKLGLHGVRATSRHQWVTKRYLPAIEGHRDVGQTACPGRYLYAKIPAIRSLAAHHQRSFSGRVRKTNLVGIKKPDFVVRSKASKQAYLVRTASTGRAGRVTRTGTYLRHANRLLSVGDWNRDGRGDMVTRSAGSGKTYLYRGNGAGRFARPVKMSTVSFGRVRLLSAVGDITGDGSPDLLGQPEGRSMRIYPGNGAHGFRHSYVAHAGITARQQLGVNLWTSDGSPDALLRRRDGTLVLYPGNGPGGLTGGQRLGSLSRGYDWVLAVGDLTGDGRMDLVARSSGTGKLWTFPRDSSGFGARRAYAGDMSRFDLAG